MGLQRQHNRQRDAERLAYKENMALNYESKDCNAEEIEAIIDDIL